MSKPLSYLEAAEKVLEDAGEPLHYQEIATRALDERLLVSRGKNPDRSLKAQISIDLKTRGSRSLFVPVEPDVFALRRWSSSGRDSSVTDVRQLQEAPGEGTGAEDLDAEILEVLEAMRRRARDSALEWIFEMDRDGFERFMLRLLRAMGYRKLVATAAGDLDLDVVGIKGQGDVRELVQLRRTRGQISRARLDQLRGSLYRSGATRGTILTTGGFTVSCREAAADQGAAPITLIDGNGLVELLAEQGLGIEKREVEVWTLDPSAFAFEAEDSGDDSPPE